MTYQEVFEEFWQHVTQSAADGQFAKLTLAKTIGKPNLKNIYVVPVKSTDEFQVQFTIQYRSKETPNKVSILTLPQAKTEVLPYLGQHFFNALLFTTAKDVTFKINKKRMVSITEGMPTFANVTYF
jgi:hypothetical protein